jgi:hypothetical protein
LWPCVSFVFVLKPSSYVSFLCQLLAQFNMCVIILSSLLLVVFDIYNVSYVSCVLCLMLSIVYYGFQECGSRVR